MGLFTGIEDVRVQRGATCTVKIVRRQLDATDAAELDTVLANEAVPSTLIAQVLKSAGHDVAAGTLSRHRRQQCRCAA